MGPPRYADLLLSLLLGGMDVTELETYAVMVICAGDADAIWHEIKAAGGQPALKPAGTAGIGYLDADHWQAVAQLRCDDLIIDKGLNCYYGLFLRCIKAFGPFSVGDYLVAVRGTMDGLEWVNDILAIIPVSVPHGVGAVGTGFWEVYASMTLNDMAGAKLSDIPAQEIVNRVKQAPGKLFVTGHSLGAALATYLTADLQMALRGSPIPLAPYFFASPRVGSPDYVNNYQMTVSAYTLVNYAADLVPAVPPSWLFATLNGGGPSHDVHTLQQGAPGSLLPANVGNNHSPVGYALMCDLANPVARSLVPAGLTFVEPPRAPGG